MTQHYSERKAGQKNYHLHTTGDALETANKRSADEKLTLFGSSFCPFVQRAWIAMEQLELPYKYFEVDVYSKPAALLEISPKGLVPALKLEGNKSLHESTVIVDYLHELVGGEGLLPPMSNPYARALVRLQIDHISKAIIPTFYKFLQAQEPENQEKYGKEFAQGLEKLLELFEKAIEQDCGFGLNAGQEKLSMSEVLVAPWIHRTRVVLKHYRNFEDPSEKYAIWANKILAHPAVKATTSSNELYIDSYERYAENRKNTSQVADAVNSGSSLP